MSSETKSRAGLVVRWRKVASTPDASIDKEFARGFDYAARMCADELEALESSASADTGTTGAEGLDARLDEAKWWDENCGFPGRGAKLRADRIASLEAQRAATQRAPVTTPGREGCEFPWAVAEMGPITVDVLKGLAEESKRLHPYMSLIYHGWIAQRLNHLVFHAVREALAAAKEPRG